MNRVTIAILALLAPIVMCAQGVKIEFFTPSVVHVVKYPGQPVTPESKVIIAKPQEVKLTRKGSTTSSSELTVKLDEKTGCITFLDAKGKVLLREKSHTFTPLNQTFTLDKGEAIYGLGTIQNGKMNRRGEHKRMEQSNLEDF
jgi:alpha-D-xyloside xylohydrolase